MCASPAQGVQFNPENQVGPTVQRWGWDIKGSQNQTSTTARADLLYDQVPANMIRIPIWVNAHFPDGSVDASLYSNEITSIQNALAENPDVEVFASVKLQSGDTFVGPPSDPNWVTQGTAQWPEGTGSIFGNPAPRPNPEFYSQLVADFFDYMDGQGIDIDYIGLNNESDGALGVSRYIDTVDRLNVELTNRGYNLSDLKYVAPDTFGPSTAINILSDLSNQGRLDTVDIVGSHQYANRSNTLNHTSDKWQTMSSISGGKDMWHTEVHMNANTDANAPANQNTIRMRGGMGIMFSANINGVDSFVWWGNGYNTDNIASTLKREIIKSTQGGHPVESPAFDEQEQDPDEPLYQAYRQGDLLTIWIAHPELADVSNLPIDFTDGFIANEGSITVTGEYWQAAGSLGNDITPTSTGNLSFNVNANQQSFTIDTLNENSVSKISVVMTGALVWNQGSDNFDMGFARSDGFQGVGATGLDPFAYGGSENLYIGNGVFVTLDSTTDMSSGSAMESIRLGTDKAADRITGTNGFGVLTVDDSVDLTIGNGGAQVTEEGDLTVGEGGFQGRLTWNSSGTLNAEGKVRIGQGGQGFFIQNNGTVVVGNTGGSNKYMGVGVGSGSDNSSYTLNNGTLIVGGGLSGGELRELRIGSDATGIFTLGDGAGAAGSAVIQTRRHIQVGHNGGTGTLTIASDGEIEQVTDGAPIFVGNGGDGTVTQNGGTVSTEHQFRLGNGVGSVGSYTISAGTLDVAWDGSGHTRIGENGGTGMLTVQGTASVALGAELFIGHTDNTGSVGTLELIGSSASFTASNLDNALGADETISWQADSAGITPLVIQGDVGSSLFVELQHPDEIAATVGGLGDGIALDLDLSQLAAGGTLTLIDNQSAEAIQGLFENPLVTNDLYEEGEIITGTGFIGTVSISYLGGTGNDVVLNLLLIEDADFNQDNKVDGLDFLIWQRGFGSAGGLSQGDANGDGQVTSDDLTIWENQFGTTPLVANSNSVPEPTTLLIVVALGCVMATQRELRIKTEDIGDLT